MGLDVRTIMVLFAMLSIMFCGLLALARLHSGNIRGIWHWSAANLCIGIGLGLAYFFSFPSPGVKFAVLSGAILLAIGIALQFTGIQSFKGARIQKRLAVGFVGVIALQTFWFEFIQPDIAWRSIVNSVVLAAGYAACAHALLARVQQPLRTAYWFTGLSFAMLAGVLFIRAVVIWQSHLDNYGLYANIPLNPSSFLAACMLQACVTFGFLLMLNYQLVAEIQKIASRDILTGAFNRRQLEEEVTRLQSRCKRTGDTFAVMLIDIDQFKFINDNYGHPVGDEVLRNLAAIAQASIRAEDYFARYGGDEFCILLPSTSAEEALGLAERLRQTYATNMARLAGLALNSTVSIGIADSSRLGLDFKKIIAAADGALYQAKQAGRNRVMTDSTNANA